MGGGVVGGGRVVSGVKTALGSEQLNFLKTFTALRMALERLVQGKMRVGTR